MISVNSEIMPLKKVLLHYPGNELLNITPDSLDRMLFDDIPYLKTVKKEYDEFLGTLRMNGVETIFLEDLMAETLDDNPEIKERFIKQFVYEAGIKTPKYKNAVIKYLMEFTDNKDLVLKTIEGIRLSEISFMEIDCDHSLVDYIELDSKFLAEPMANLMFMRDNFTAIGDGLILNRMYSKIRNRETIYAEYILNYNKDYNDIKRYYDRYISYSIEGGDILILNDHVLLIGISQRTSALAIEQMALNIFNQGEYDTILAFKIPSNRAYMHLDTVLTQIDYDKFVYYPGILNDLEIFIIKEDVMSGLKVKKINDGLEDTLEKYLGLDITMIPCGGGDNIIGAREQWNGGCNILCISPGVVLSYDRNNITNQVLKRFGIKVIEMDSSEISHGRGGTRSLVMPLIRKN